MTDNPEYFDRLASAVLRLRSSLSLAFIALADIENCDTIEQARSRAKAARLEARERLRAGRASADLAGETNQTS